jgi:hypothetical protein
LEGSYKLSTPCLATATAAAATTARSYNAIICDACCSTNLHCVAATATAATSTCTACATITAPTKYCAVVYDGYGIANIK